MDVNFRHLKAFQAVARHLSYSRAAERLFISQPALSRQVQELEKAMGSPVFHRQGRRISLTEAGRRAYDYAQRVLDLTEELEQAIQDLQEVARGHLRLVASSTVGIYLLPPFLSRFRHLYPEVEITLQICNSQQAVAFLLQDGFHLGFVSMEVEAPGLQWQTLGADELVVVASPGHPFLQRPITPQELCAETVLLREPGSGSRRCLELELERLGQRPQRTLEMGSTEAIKRAVAAGLGLSAIPRCSLAAGEALGLVRVEGMELRRPLGILTRKGSRLPAAALAFAAGLRKEAM